MKNEFHEVRLPAVWLPHGVLGISNSEIIRDETSGKFGPFATSAAFGNSLIGKKSLIEFFLRSSFSATFTAFNGTAQGNIFSNDFQYAVEDLSNFHTSMSHGLFVNLRNFGFSLDNTFSYGKVNKGVRFIYGSFRFNYRF